MNNRIRYKGRLSQMIIYLGKLFRMFVYQNDWKVFPMAAIIASLVVFVVGRNMFRTQEGTVTGCFALICVCIWNGFFNSIQVVCRERSIVKREHRSGLHMSAYLSAHLIYQLALCTVQVIITLIICRIAGVKIPAAGPVTGSGLADMALTLLLVTYTADVMSLMVSCAVRNTTTAMTVMPFILIFQLIFSGSFFQLSGFAMKITALTVSKWGLDSLCAIGGFNDLPMVTLWNTLFKFRNVEIGGYKPILELIRNMEAEGTVSEFNLWAGKYNFNANYVTSGVGVAKCWLMLVLLIVVFAAAALIVLEFIDRDRR